MRESDWLMIDCLIWMCLTCQYEQLQNYLNFYCFFASKNYVENALKLKGNRIGC
jgi:hypothetical protein